MCCKYSNSSAQRNSQLHQRNRSGPEAALDVVKDSKYPHTTCSALSLSWKREDNVLSHPPTLTTLYLCLFVKCLLQRAQSKEGQLVYVKNGPQDDNHGEYHQQR